MDFAAKAASLSDIERKGLTALTDTPEAAERLAEKAGINADSARRAAAWLESKGFAKVAEVKKTVAALTQEGEKALEKGLPEERLLEALAEKGEMHFSEAAEKAGLSKQEFNIALGINRKNAFIVVVKKEEPLLSLTEVAKEFSGKESAEKKCLAEIKSKGECGNNGVLDVLVKRGLAEMKDIFTRKYWITEDGKKALGLKEFTGKRKYNIQEPVPELAIGKKQPYIQFLNIIRRKLTELGFVEMESPLIVHEFYNFDALFQPQNHPARTWTDTYQLKGGMKGKLTDRKSVKAIKAAHETGGVSASSGWGYNWLEEIASKVMPAAHGTAHSARQLTKGVSVPGKYFAIARCFRPDVLDATHLIEFNQTEGFIVGEDLNFTHLLGILEQFAKEIAGAKEVRFYPDYYPFTEPSVQLSAKHPELGWVELGGAGMFRPEIMENLGIKGRAIAWGIGIDRLAMFKLGINDIRHLFSDDLKWLRESRSVIE